MKTSEEKIELFEDKDLSEKDLEEKIKSTKGLLQTFLQTLKAYRLYEANHPILNKFLERVKKEFDQYFEEYDSFSLQIGEFRLFYRGNVVYENQDIKESLAFLFYKDGIREIQFAKGLEFQEMMDFLTIVRKSDFLNRMEDDLVTLFWEKDFFHITFTTVDEFIDGSGIFVPATEEDLLKRSEYPDSQETWFSGGAGEGEGTEESSAPTEGVYQAFNPAPGITLVQACLLTSDEGEKIKKEVDQDQQPGYFYLLVNNLIEILLHLGEDADAYENMISYFDRVIEFLLEQKELKETASLLLSLNDTIESMALKDKQIFAVRRILEQVSSPRNIERLGKLLKGGVDVHEEIMLRYFQFFTKQAVEPLCVLLGKQESAKWRKTISDRLVELSKDDIQPLSKFLTDPNPLVVSQVLSILGRIGHPSTAKYLGSLATHRDMKVREEILQLLGKLGEKGKDLLQRLLKDSVSGIRAKAALTLAKSVKRGAVKPLIEIILSEDFYKREYEEKASFFRAIGETESKEVIPILEGIAKKKKWLQKEKWDEMRQCASRTLKMIEARESSKQKSQESGVKTEDLKLEI